MAFESPEDIPMRQFEGDMYDFCLDNNPFSNTMPNLVILSVIYVDCNRHESHYIIFYIFTYQAKIIAAYEADKKLIDKLVVAADRDDEEVNLF